MRLLSGTCALLAVAGTFTTGLFAQSANTNSALMLQQPVSQNCPVSLRANHLSGGAIAHAAESSHKEGRPLRISFTPNDAHGIAQADLVLHGMSGTHVVPAGDQTHAPLTESFSVSPTPASDHRFDTVVFLEKLTAIRYLDVRSITFADGTVWHASATSTCRVAPDGFMLVADGR